MPRLQGGHLTPIPSLIPVGEVRPTSHRPHHRPIEGAPLQGLPQPLQPLHLKLELVPVPWNRGREPTAPQHLHDGVEPLLLFLAPQGFPPLRVVLGEDSSSLQRTPLPDSRPRPTCLDPSLPKPTPHRRGPNPEGSSNLVLGHPHLVHLRCPRGGELACVPVYLSPESVLGELVGHRGDDVRLHKGPEFPFLTWEVDHPVGALAVHPRP